MKVVTTKKHFLLLLALVALLGAGILSVRMFKRPAQPAVVHRELSWLESGLLWTGGNSGASLFTIDADLPPLTKITIWLEYYRNGKYQMRLNGANLSLDRPQRDLTILLTRESAGQGEYDNWGVALLASGFRSHAPFSLTKLEDVYGEMARSVSQPLVYGEPMTLSFHATGSENSWPDGSRRTLTSDGKPLPLEDEITVWMEVDRLLILKLQIDPPEHKN